MKKMNRLFFAILSCSIFLASCSDDNSVDEGEVSLGQYEDGVFVLNEGNSNISSATVSFMSYDGALENDVYTNVNPNSPKMGTYLQCMFFDDTRAFIISGQANKITVVDRYTFKFIANVDTNFTNPRYGTVANGKAYVTNAGADWSSASDDFLTAINLSDYSTSKIAIGNWCEKITEENGKVYIFNGYYGDGSSVSVLNPNSNTVEKVIELGFSPTSFEEENETLYVLGSGKLAKINLANNTLLGTPMAITAESKDIAVEGNKIYYTVGNAVYEMPLNAVAAPASPLFSYSTTSQDGVMYGFAVKGDKIYIADAGNFSSSSHVYTYSLAGSLLKSTIVGVGPNGFYFN
ncbi:DUF5074 domain-containing protein [uncultured Flavobacterium sp.]|uniref:DUF5074 domain-containing protein n=1 Tax=uncultured Flavobacterium sp. TaxID=165435 RepID=UPI0025F6D250|nr:DUF5074 domain-containing protein [uncultured Flavobacterium sp.]